MLSKLLSNINASNKASGGNTLGSTGKEGEMDSSEQIFKSLLQSLQSEGESEKGKQQLLALSSQASEQQESGEGDSEQLNILGGSFTMMGEEAAEDLEKVDQNILKELQKEFQNIKNELIANAENESSSEDADAKNKEASDNDGQKVVIGDGDAVQSDTAGDEENENSESEDTESKIRKGSTDKAVQLQKGQVRSEGESENSEDKNMSGKPDQNSASKIIGGQSSEETSAKTGGTNKENSDKAVPVGNGEAESSQSKANETEKTESSAKQKMSSSAQNEVFSKLQEEQVDAESSEESKNKNTEKAKPGLQIFNDDNQTVRVEKTSGLSKKDIRSDALRQSAEGKVNTENSGNSGITQTSSQIDETKTVKTELNDQQKKVMSSFFQKDNSANISSKGLEIKGSQNPKNKKNSKDNTESDPKKARLGKLSSEGRNKILSRLGLSSSKAQKDLKPLNLQNFSGISVSDSNGSLQEQKLNWEDQVTKTLETSNEKESKGGSGAGSMRLGQMPVTNASLKKKILPGLTQNIHKAASSAKKDSGDWQKHSFTLDDGKNVQLSVRETKGVLQVKVGSMNLDLSKLLQQNLQQIREHLKQEFGSDIDLQFDNQQSGEESHFSENADQSNRKRNYRNNFAGEGVATENTDPEHTKTVRNFGYNKMEWTA